MAYREINSTYIECSQDDSLAHFEEISKTDCISRQDGYHVLKSSRVALTKIPIKT